MDHFKAQLRGLREERGLSQRDLADRLGVRRETVGRWERGELEPPLTRVDQIAGALGVNASALFEEVTP